MIFFERIKKICKNHQILLIADEVQTGIGRTGKLFASEYWHVVPDLIITWNYRLKGDVV